MVTRRLLPVAALAALVITVVALGGWPRPGSWAALVGGASATDATVADFVVLLCWTAIALLVVALVSGASPLSRLRKVRRARSLPVAVLIIGLAVLGAGIARHQAGYRVCCADPTTSAKVQTLVH